MKKIFLVFLLFSTTFIHAQFSAFDGFDDNSSGWLTRNDDSAKVYIDSGQLDAEIKYDGDFLDAKGAVIDSMKPFRAEISTGYISGAANIPYGLCWGAGDVNNYFAFYITGDGRYGFKMQTNNVWKEIIAPTPNSFINVKGVNWLRVNAVNVNGKMKLNLCINELVVKTIDFMAPYGTFFGIYIGGRQHLLFDNFIVYQRGKTQEEFEPCDLSVSLNCKMGELGYSNEIYKWKCCMTNGMRVDEDSAVVRFWYSDARAGDYSVIIAELPSTGSVEFSKAADQDMRDYLAEGDSIITISNEPIAKISVGNEQNIYRIGAVYTAHDLDHNLYIRRYYLQRTWGNSKGMVFQFIVPEHSPSIDVLDQLVKEIISTSEFN
ncbi:MAG: hypothetical protein HY064_12805 [Bacteroidetes bacterium]|nr:hypothetical protein [Bacteroidota bacterium]